MAFTHSPKGFSHEPIALVNRQVYPNPGFDGILRPASTPQPMSAEPQVPATRPGCGSRLCYASTLCKESTDTTVQITRRVIDDKTCVVALDGDLNASSVDEVKDVFRQVADEPARQVVLDRERIHSIDSSGLAALISGLNTMNEAAASLKLAALQSQADHPFELTTFDQVFEIFDDPDKATRSFPS